MKEIVCIVCPNGCTLHIDNEGDSVKVTGNKCRRGEQFAVAELECPMRTICSTVKTSFADAPVLPVRVSADIPKSRIFDVMQAINSVKVTEPLHRGDVVIPDVLGLGVDVIATSDLLTLIEKENEK